MTSSLYRKARPALSACAPDWCERLFTIWNILLRRPVGLDDDVPNVATPAMLTAGPTGSVGGASRLPYASCPRVSSTVRDVRASVLLTAMVWSRFSSADEADAALRPPAPRAFCALTS